MTFTVLGIGTAVPPTTVNQEDAEGLARSLCCRTAEQASWLPSIYRQSGINKRHLCHGRDAIDDIVHRTHLSNSIFVPTDTNRDTGPTTAQRMQHYRQEAGPLATRAAVEALGNSGVAPREITHLITISCTGFFAPAVDIALIRELHLRPDTQRTHVGFMGCHGALNGLRVARAFAEADAAARVLVCAVELCSIHYHYSWDPQQIITNALFADGAAAVVGGATEANDWRLAASGSYVFPDTENAMSWNISDHGYAMTLSKRVPELIARNLRTSVQQWLDGQGLRVQDIGSWAIHPGGPKILSSVGDALGLSEQQTAASREILADYGNMSSPTLLFILQRLRKAQAPRPCVALGFGPGLVVEAALFT